jgi:hypothetical protein
MELASMLAGGRCSDRPAFVCPVIGALLRSSGYSSSGPSSSMSRSRSSTAAVVSSS